jgi:hypothetical protein
MTHITAILMLMVPTGWELANDANGDKNKTRDVFVRVILMTLAGVLNFFWVTGKAVFDSIILSMGINFMVFDYAIAYWLIRQKAKGGPGIEPPKGTTYHWFSYLSGSPFDSLWRNWNPWVRFTIRVVVLLTAIAIYIIER